MSRQIMQKDRAAFHRLEDAALAFDAQALGCNTFLVRHPAHQRFRLMDVQIIEHDVPLRGLGIAGVQMLKIGQNILPVRALRPQDGSMMCPVTTSKLINQDNVPCRMYSNSRRST